MRLTRPPHAKYSQSNRPGPDNGDHERHSVMSEMFTSLKGKTMNRNLPPAIAFGGLTAITSIAAALVTSANAYADDITVEQAPFVSTLTREEVRAQLKTPDPAGDPSPSRDDSMSSDAIKTEYILSRDEVRALTAEDSGSAHFLKAPVPAAPNPRDAMGASRQ